jgi:hypothetical protein
MLPAKLQTYGVALGLIVLFGIAGGGLVAWLVSRDLAVAYAEAFRNVSCWRNEAVR